MHIHIWDCKDWGTLFMNEREKQLFAEYTDNYYIEAKSYELLGKMLDEQFVVNRLKVFDIVNAYIYGGTYMAIQLFRASKNYVNIVGIVDKMNRMMINEDVKVLTVEELRNVYNGEKIIITLPRFYSQIKSILIEFVDEVNIIYIGELIEGIVDQTGENQE